MGDLVFTAIYTLVFGFAFGIGLYWLRHPRQFEIFLRGTVFEHWSWWIVPWMAWGLVALGGLTLGFQIWGWLG